MYTHISHKYPPKLQGKSSSVIYFFRPKSGRGQVKMRSGEVESPTKYASDLGTQMSQNEEHNSGMSGGKLVKLMI